MRIAFLSLFLFCIPSFHAQNGDDENQETLLSQIVQSSQDFAVFRKRLESDASGWLMARHPEYDNFYLSLLSLNSMDSLDMRNLRYCTFAVSPVQKESFVMVCILDQVYIGNERNLTVKEIREEQWRRYLFEYLCAAHNSSISHPDSIAVYKLTSGYKSKKAEKLWARTLKQHPEYAKTSFEKIRLNTENKRYEYLYGVFSLEQISSVSKKGIGFKSNVYEKEVSISAEDIGERQWKSRDCGDCKVVLSKTGMTILYPDNDQLVEISYSDIESINSLLLKKP